MIVLKEGSFGDYSHARVVRADELDMFTLTGWKIVAMFEVEVPVQGNKYLPNYGIVTEHVGMAREARFLCVKGGRDEVIENLQKRCEDLESEHERLTKAHLEDEKKYKDLFEQVGSTARIVEDRDRSIETLQKSASFHAEKTRKMEADLGKMRAALGELRMKEILGS
jgi:chaperonin cofactor prefoldin